MLQVKTESFILDKVLGYNDDGKITLFTRKLGVLDVVASGLCRPGSRLSAWTEPPSLVIADLTLPEENAYHGRLLTLSSKKNFPVFWQSYVNASWYYFYFFLLSSFLPRGIKSDSIYDLWKELLNSTTFDNARSRNFGFIYFTIQLLKNQGFYPSFKFCVHCGKSWEVQETAYCYLPEQGLTCRDCLRKSLPRIRQDGYNYSLDFLEFLPLKNRISLPRGVLRIKSEERQILELTEKSSKITAFFANINSCSKINDSSLKKVRNFLLIFLAPLL